MRELQAPVFFVAFDTGGAGAGTGYFALPYSTCVRATFRRGPELSGWLQLFLKNRDFKRWFDGDGVRLAQL